MKEGAGQRGKSPGRELARGSGHVEGKQTAREVI